MRRLGLVVTRVAVRLIDGHGTVTRVAVVVGRLRLVLRLLCRRLRVRGLRRLHHVACWRRVLLLMLVLRLVLGLSRHVRVSSGLRWRHLLVVCAGLLVDLCYLVHARTARGCKRMVAGIGHGARTLVHWGARRRHTRLRAIGFGRWGASCLGPVLVLLLVTIPFLGALVLAASHPNIASYADTATLLSDHTAKRSALGQTRELLGGENGERRRLDLASVGDEAVAVMDHVRVLWIKVLDFAEVLKQSKAQAVFALMANRQVREDEVTSRTWAVEIGHTGNRSTSEDRRAGDGGRSTSWCDGTGILETGMQEEVGVVSKGDVLVVLENAQLNNRWRINRTAVGARLGSAATGTGTLGLLDYLHLVANATTILGGAMGCVFGLVRARDRGERHGR